ncbi:hypothetical protein QTO34_000836 [Cnephaeus nilssonii]|uniref:Uncharacterized protein n=1 Tax=Cnephaeus nilssonii TaxID=3371016 RepID=A0AA40ICR2_CNENI|nr:hypothetical protein QTO34_000836 [Eptesicus nilssonii]
MVISSIIEKKIHQPKVLGPFLVNKHKSKHFSFFGLNNQSNLTDMQCQTTFYTAFGHLLMVD